MRHQLRLATLAVLAGLAASGVAACQSGDTTTSLPPGPTQATPTGSAPAAPAKPGRSTCDATDLRFAMIDEGSEKFQQSGKITIRNDGTKPCTLTGYLGIRFMRGDRRLPIDQLQQGAPPAPVTLRPGDTASTRLVWNRYEGTGTSCKPLPTDLALTLPGQKKPTTTVPWLAGIAASVCGTTVTNDPIIAGS